MATASKSALISGLTYAPGAGAWSPSTGYRITGGTADDRLTIADIVSALTEWSRDTDTGVVTRSEVSPTARTWIFGGGSSSGAKDTYIQLDNTVFELENGTASNGNSTDKIIFDHQCDVVIGVDTGNDSGPLNGNVIMRVENYANNQTGFCQIFNDQCLVTCYGYFIVAGRPNSRTNWVNQNSSSKIRAVIAAHSLDPWCEGGNVGANFNLSVDSAEFSFASHTISARDNLISGGLTGDTLSVPSAVIGSSDTRFRIIFASLDNVSNLYKVDDLASLTKIGASDQPPFTVQYVDDASECEVRLRQYGCKRGDAYFSFINNDGDLVVSVQRRLDFSFSSPAGTSLTADKLRVESSTFATTFSATAGGTPTITETSYGTVDSSTSQSSRSVVITDKSLASNHTDNQDEHDIDDSSVVSAASTGCRYSAWIWGRTPAINTAVTLADETGIVSVPVVMATDALITASAKPALSTAVTTFDDIYDALAAYAQDNNEAIGCSVSSGRLTFTDGNVTFALAGSTGRSSGTTTIASAATVTAGSKITSLAATGTVTVNTGVSVTGPYADSTGVRVQFTGLPAGTSGVVRAWPLSQGTTDRTNAITGSVADTSATTITVTLAASTTYYFVLDALGYRRSAVGQVNTTNQTTATAALEQILDTTGNELIPSSLDATETVEAGLVTWAADYIDISATSANPSISFDALVYAVEQGQSTAAACGSLLYPARIEIGRVIFPSSSSQKWRRLSTATVVPDIESTSVGKDGSSDAGDYIDFTNGGIKYKSEPPVVANITTTGGGGGGDAPTVSEIVTGIQAADFEAGSGSETLAQVLQGIRTSVGSIPTTAAPTAAQVATAVDAPTVADIVAGVPSAADIAAAVDALTAAEVTAAVPTAAAIATAVGAPTAAQIVAAIQAADFEAGSGSETLAQVLQGIRTSVGSIPTTNVGAILNDSDDGLAAIKAAVDAAPTAADVAAAVLAAAVETDIDVQDALRLVLALLAGPTTVTDSGVTFARLDADSTDVATVTLDDEDQRTVTTIL